LAGQTLSLFGMSWERVGDEFRPSDAAVPVLPASRLTLRNESGASARLEMQLAVDWGGVAGGGRFELDGSVSLTRTGDAWVVAATPAPALRRARVGLGDLPADRLRVELGPVQHATSEAELRVLGVDLALATRDNLSSATVWLQDLATDRHEMPVKVRTDRIVARVDLSHASVTFAPGSFAAAVLSPYETRASDGVVDIRPVYEAGWESAAWTAGLAPVSASASLGFLPGSDGPGPVRLLLNGELSTRSAVFGAGPNGGNTLLPALEATDARLVFDLAANRTAARRPTLTALRLRPVDPAAGARFGLVCWAAVAEDDTPLTLRAAEATLRVRLGRAAASDPCNIPALVIDLLEADAASLPGELHAARPSAWGLLRGGAVRVVGRHVVPAVTAARLGVDLAALPTHPQLADGAWCLESLPVLERGDDRGTVAEQARYQVPLRDLTPGGGGDPHQTGVEPLRFSGTFFGWPLLDVEWLRAGNWEFDAPQQAGGAPAPVPPPPALAPTGEDDPSDGADPLSGTFQDEGRASGHPVRQAVAELNAVIAGPAVGPKARQGEQTHASLTRIGPVTGRPRMIGELVPDQVPAAEVQPLAAPAEAALSLSASSGVAAAPAAALSPPRPLLGRHDLVQKYGSLMVPLDVPQESDGSEDVLADPIDLLPSGGDLDGFTGLYPHQLPAGSGAADFGSWFRMPLISNADPSANPIADVVKGFPVAGATTQAVVLAKNRRGVPLTDVIDRLPPSRQGTRFLIRQLIDSKQIDPDLLSPSWTGLILLCPGFQVLVPGLERILGKFLAEPFQYVAVTAQNPGRPREFPEVYGTYRYEADAWPPTPASILQAQDHDVEWDLRLIDIRFRAREIVRFELSGFLTIRRLFRIAINGPWEFEITGKYQSASDVDNPTKKPRIVLEGAPKEPLRVDVNVGPVLAARLDRARVSVEGIDPDTPTGSGGRFEIDGAVLLDPHWSLGVIGVDPDHAEVPIRRLGLSLGKTPRMTWDWPSLEFPLVQREPLKLGPVSFRFLRLGMGGGEVLDGTIRIGGGGDVVSPRLPYAVARVELFKYPELGSQGGRGLGFDLVAAFDQDGASPKFGLKGIDFSRLDIDLFRFLRLRIEHVEGQSAGPGKGTYLLIEGVKLDLLGKTIVDDLNVGLFQVGTERGFVAYLNQEIELLPGLVTIDWLLLSYNLRLPRTTPLLLGLNDVGTADVRRKIKEDITEASPLAGQARGARWGFGFGCQILDGALRVKLLFVDGGSMGLMISSEFLEDVLGFEGFAVGYLKGARPEDDRFWSEIPVPMMSAGPISFLGGVIGLEKFLRGGFTFDAGFPWLRDGIREWDRGFGFSVGIYVGHAGFYMKYLPGTMPGPGGSGTAKTLLLAGGFGVAVGYGFCMTFAGVFTVYASIEVYAIIEGSVLLRYEMPALPGLAPSSPALGGPGTGAGVPAVATGAATPARGGSLEIVALELRGIIGIVARGVGELNVWVLSARAEILVFAEAESHLAWAKGQPAKVAYIFRAGYRVSASCRVGAGIFSFTFRFSLEVTFEFGGEIEL
jgi:hypothetical protein